MENREALALSFRYLVLILLGLFNLKVFYYVFTPLTVRPVYGILSVFYDNANLLSGNMLFFAGQYAQIIPACIAGAAYYLLLILNLATPMKIGKRIKSILFLFGVFLALNIARIALFAGLLASGYQYFDAAHRLVWYFGSTLMVVIIWFANVWIFRIREVPIYDDAKELFEDLRSGKK